ncbi:ATPase AAA-2 domain-containing protein [Alicyclobacillus hesperidum URH17-3-68]|nr:ATPase AAA-2 domain-containing protein [Alicyclobacillus hesperidum URH17-3-68]
MDSETNTYDKMPTSNASNNSPNPEAVRILVAETRLPRTVIGSTMPVTFLLNQVIHGI